MKKLYALVVIVLFLQQLNVQCQVSIPSSISQQHLHQPIISDDAYLFRAQHQINGTESLHTIFIDYDSTEVNTSGSVSDAFMWEVNSNANCIDTFVMDYFIMSFDTLIDAGTLTPYYGGSAVITIDSLYISFGHENNSGLNDSIIISVLLSDANGYPSNTIVWSDTIISDTSLTAALPNFSWLQTGMLAVSPGITLSQGQKFSVKINYYGAMQDTFGLISYYYKDAAGNCDAACGSIKPFMYPTSYYFLNYPQGTGLCDQHPDSNGVGLYTDCNTNSQYDFCEEYYLQNHAIFAQLTIDADVIGGFTGKVFVDQNQNALYDLGEQEAPGQFVNVQPNNYSASTSLQGNYYLAFLDSSIQHTISYSPPLNWQTTTPSSYLVTPQSQPTYDLNFGITPTASVDDLVIDATSGQAVPGFTCNQWMHYSNAGTTFMSGTISYKLDNKLSFVQSSPTPDQIIGDSLVWDFSNLSPFGSNNISVQTILDANALIGDSVLCYANIEPSSTDATPLDNSSAVIEIITGSYDPNDKAVSPRGLGTEHCIIGNETLTYLIRFQNTGNDTAFNIVVRDTLTQNIDALTFHLISNSHFVQTEIDDDRKIAFVFPNILLPDSNVNEPLSHGFVKYSVEPVAALPVSTVIDNDASIYFDFNSAVLTNTAFNTICNPDAIENVNVENGIVVYPNPTSDEFFIESTQNISSIIIFDLLGKELFRIEKIDQQKISISLDGISSGVYLITIETSEGEVVRKVVKN